MADDAGDQLALARIREVAEEIPHSHALGIKVLEVTRDRAVYLLPYDARLIGNPETGVLHGGAITALLDGCSGTAVFGRIGQLLRIATLDLRIDYLRPAEPGKPVTAHATCYKLTRNVGFTRAVAFHEDPDDPIAHAVGTFMVSGTPGGAGSPGTPPPIRQGTP
ncbi:MAG: PaaI family thioesterase [Kofleriaceae bacterium]